MADETARVVFVPPPSPLSSERAKDAVALADYLLRLNRWSAEELDKLQSLTGGLLRWQNLRSILISGTTDGGGLIALTHNLGKIPEFFIANSTLDARVWATTAQRNAWTTSSMVITSSDTSGATHHVLVM